jgi:hypothetical protein
MSGSGKQVSWPNSNLYALGLGHAIGATSMRDPVIETHAKEEYNRKNPYLSSYMAAAYAPGAENVAVMPRTMANAHAVARTHSLREQRERGLLQMGLPPIGVSAPARRKTLLASAGKGTKGGKRYKKSRYTMKKNKRRTAK